MADDLTKREKPDRLRIHMHETWEVNYWTKHLGVTERLQKAVDRFATLLQPRGNNSARVRRGLRLGFVRVPMDEKEKDRASARTSN